MIQWEKGSNIIAWTSEDAEADDVEVTTMTTTRAIFHNASKEMASKCVDKLKRWLEQRPFRYQQFVMIEKDFNMVWNALIVQFGLPRVEMEIKPMHA